MKKKTLEEQAKRYVERLKPESTSEAKSYFRAFYDKKKSKQKELEDKRKEVAEWVKKCFRDIENNPSIMQKPGLMWRLVGCTMSQADYLKVDVLTRAQIMLINLESMKITNSREG